MTKSGEERGIMSEEQEGRQQGRNQKENHYLFSYHVPRIIGSSDMGSSLTLQFKIDDLKDWLPIRSKECL